MLMESLPCIRDDEKFREELFEIRSREDIPKEWQGTPIEAFIMSQNFGWPIQQTGKPELLIATCIEFRYALPMPRMYSYVIRRASGRIIGSEFSVAYTLAKGVNCLLMIGHNDCGMTKVEETKPLLVDALVNQGWNRELAKMYVDKHGDRHEIFDELWALKDEYVRVRNVFPKLLVAPMFVCLFDSKLYLPKWYPEVAKMPVPDHVPNHVIAQLR
jgi:carbonic anhydrase